MKRRTRNEAEQATPACKRSSRKFVHFISNLVQSVVSIPHLITRAYVLNRLFMCSAGHSAGVNYHDSVGDFGNAEPFVGAGSCSTRAVPRNLCSRRSSFLPHCFHHTGHTSKQAMVSNALSAIAIANLPTRQYSDCRLPSSKGQGTQTSSPAINCEDFPFMGSV